MSLVLIVEDREEVARIWTIALEKIGMTVKWAPNFREAVRLSLEIPPPDLILLDLGLPDSGAKETIANIELLKQGNKDALVLVVSGLLTPEIVAAAFAHGANGTLCKLEIRRREDLWHNIKSIIDKGPTKVRESLKFTSDLIEQLTETIKT